MNTDLLEHVPDLVALLAAMVDTLRSGDHLFIANCFYPVIHCHLPCTFHLRNSFDSFCQDLGLEVLGPCVGSHATIYRRTSLWEPDWPGLRARERRSKRLVAWRQWKVRHLSPWGQQALLVATKPQHHSRKIVRASSADN